MAVQATKLRATRSGSWTQIDINVSSPHDREFSSTFPWLNLNFDVGGPIHPGEPVNASWQLWSFNRALQLGQITATFFLVDKKGTELVLKTVSGIKYAVDHSSGNSGYQQVTIQVDPQLNYPLAKSLYEIGTKTIHLRLTGNGLDPGPYEAEADLAVEPEAVDATWWQWTTFSSDHPNFAAWNKDYFLAGKLFNKSQLTMMTGTVTLHEVEFTDPNHPGGDVPPSQTKDIEPDPKFPFEVTFASSKKTWPWFVDNAFVITGPLKRDFRYTVRFTLDDHMGNIYGPFVSSVVSILVSVSDEKIALAVIALHEQNHAVAAGIAALFFPPAAAMAAAAQAAAFAAAFLAKDPPEANLHFRERVKIQPVTLPAAFDTDPRVSKFRPLFETTNLILATCSALSEVESRLLGARRAHDQKSIEMQESSYRAFVRQMVEDSARLPSAISNAAPETLIDPTLLQKTLSTWRVAGIPADARSKLTNAGMPQNQLTQMDEAIRNPEIADLVAEGPTLILGRGANALGSLVQFIQQKTELTLSGHAHEAVRSSPVWLDSTK